MAETQIPLDPVASIAAGIEAHESRVAELRELVRAATDELAVHEALLRLARHEELVRAARDGAAGEIDAVSRSVDLPDGAVLGATSASAGVLSAVLRCGDWEVEVGWHPEAGFFARPDTRALSVRRAVVAVVDPVRRREAALLDGAAREGEPCR